MKLRFFSLQLTYETNPIEPNRPNRFDWANRANRGSRAKKGNRTNKANMYIDEHLHLLVLELPPAKNQ